LQREVLFGPVFGGLNLFRNYEDAEEDAASGDSEDEDGSAESFALTRGRAGGSVFAEAASLRVRGQGQDEKEGEQADSDHRSQAFC
jgi:hypothetical protein